MCNQILVFTADESHVVKSLTWCFPCFLSVFFLSVDFRGIKLSVRVDNVDNHFKLSCSSCTAGITLIHVCIYSLSLDATGLTLCSEGFPPVPVFASVYCYLNKCKEKLFIHHHNNKHNNPPLQAAFWISLDDITSAMKVSITHVCMHRICTVSQQVASDSEPWAASKWLFQVTTFTHIDFQNIKVNDMFMGKSVRDSCSLFLCPCFPESLQQRWRFQSCISYSVTIAIHQIEIKQNSSLICLYTVPLRILQKAVHPGANSVKQDTDNL